jgi:hypothetical protein
MHFSKPEHRFVQSWHSGPAQCMSQPLQKTSLGWLNRAAVEADGERSIHMEAIEDAVEERGFSDPRYTMDVHRTELGELILEEPDLVSPPYELTVAGLPASVAAP